MSDDPSVIGIRQVQHARSVCRGFAGALLPVVVALALAACGTIPPEPSTSASAPARPDAATTPVRAPATPSTEPSATPSASPTPRPKAPEAKAAKAKVAKAKPKKPGRTTPDTYVARFKGHQVRVPRGHGATLSFTFDDGPWPGSTAKVLTLLEQHHVHAVFCVIGNQARAYPSLVRREVAAGHELCNHSRDHDLTMNKKGAKYVDAEVGDGLAAIRRAAPRGTPVRFYRQPGGLWSPAVVKAMRARGHDPLRWSNDPRDWSRPGSAVIVRRVVSQLRPGAVILMHDGGGDRSQSVEALEFLLDAVIAAGWKPVLPPHVKLSAKAAARPQ